MINLKGVKSFSGSSQDELVLLNVSQTSGICSFEDRGSTSLTIKTNGDMETYKIIKVNDFTSERKMMSVVVENIATG